MVPRPNSVRSGRKAAVNETTWVRLSSPLTSVFCTQNAHRPQLSSKDGHERGKPGSATNLPTRHALPPVHLRIAFGTLANQQIRYAMGNLTLLFILIIFFARLRMPYSCLRQKVSHWPNLTAVNRAGTSFERCFGRAMGKVCGCGDAKPACRCKWSKRRSCGRVQCLVQVAAFIRPGVFWPICRTDNRPSVQARTVQGIRPLRWRNWRRKCVDLRQGITAVRFGKWWADLVRNDMTRRRSPALPPCAVPEGPKNLRVDIGLFYRQATVKTGPSHQDAPPHGTLRHFEKTTKLGRTIFHGPTLWKIFAPRRLLWLQNLWQ